MKVFQENFQRVLTIAYYVIVVFVWLQLQFWFLSFDFSELLWLKEVTRNFC